jgi:hypothetical protein
MTEQYIGWALVLGLAIGGALVWFAVGRLPRSGEEVPAEERAAEADWISETIGERGGQAPVDLVEEGLELHVRYLERDEMDGSWAPISTPEAAADPQEAPTGHGAPTAHEPPAEQDAPASTREAPTNS